MTSLLLHNSDIIANGNPVLNHFWVILVDHTACILTLENQICNELDSQMALDMGLVTFSFDDIDWEDEVRIFLEERSSFSPDSMTGLEANLRFAGPETMETKIFGRLTAWQNWIFQRPNAVGEEGALKKYGSGKRSKFNWERV